MKKTILIDLRWIKSKTFDGIARESFEVTKRLVLDKNNNFLLLYFNDDIKNWDFGGYALSAGLLMNKGWF